MDLASSIVFVVVGGVAGWLAGEIMKGRGFGLPGNVLVGIVGAFLGGFLFGLLDVTLVAGVVGTLIQALIGAVVLLALVGLVRKA